MYIYVYVYTCIFCWTVFSQEILCKLIGTTQTTCVFLSSFSILLREGVNKKKREKSGQADRLGGGGGVTSLQPDRFYFVKILARFVHYKMAK